jgi:hypothetical protein
MKHIKIILGLVLLTSATTFAQSPRIKLNQITKDTVKGSVLISSPTDSGMVYSRDFYISYGADTVLILYGDTLAATSGIISSVLSDGVTITGDGTVGSELTVDTSTVIATKGDLNNIDLASQVTGTLPIANGGTGSTTLAGAGIVQALGTTNYLPKFTGSTTIGNSAITEDGTTVNLIGRALSGTSAIFSGNMNADDYNMASWKILDWSGNIAQIGGISSGQWNQIDFFTSGTSKMTILSNGNVGIGTSPSVQLELSTDGAKKLTTTTWTTGSDRRIKKNIINYDKGLNEIIQLNPVEYELNGKANTINGAKGIGLIAQEVQPIIPEAVIGYYGKLNEDDEFDSYLYNINTHSFFFMFINAFKEQQDIIESQATEIEQLKTLITELSNRLQILENN